MPTLTRQAIDLTRAGLAKQTGCNIETIRYYENIGLLPPPRRKENGYRVYDGADVRRLAFIMRLRELGFTIEEARGFLKLVDGHDYTCREVHAITVDHVDDIESKIRDLTKIRDTLSTMAEECSRGEVPDCPVIEVLYGEG